MRVSLPVYFVIKNLMDRDNITFYTESATYAGYKRQPNRSCFHRHAGKTTKLRVSSVDFCLMLMSGNYVTRPSLPFTRSRAEKTAL